LMVAALTLTAESIAPAATVMQTLRKLLIAGSSS